MRTIKILIVCAILFSFSALSVNAQTNPFINAQIEGNSTISISSSFTCYDVPQVAGATYSWTNNFWGLKTVCGTTTQSHIGYVSPSYHPGANIVWGYTYIDPVTLLPITINGWHYGPVPPYGFVSLFEEPCWIRCKVTYNGVEYFFRKDVMVQVTN